MTRSILSNELSAFDETQAEQLAAKIKPLQDSASSAEASLELKQDAAYTPDEETDWDGPPTTIQEALDELAARVRILEP